MSAEIGSDQVWIMADELPAMEYQPQIEKLITRGRKRGLAVVMGFQNVSQLRSIYGRDGAITLTSSPTTKVILRCDEAETAKWASELLGSREVERMTMTQLAGLSTYREGVNLQPHRSTEHIVTRRRDPTAQAIPWLSVRGRQRPHHHQNSRTASGKAPASFPAANQCQRATANSQQQRNAADADRSAIHAEHVARRAESAARPSVTSRSITARTTTTPRARPASGSGSAKAPLASASSGDVSRDDFSALLQGIHPRSGAVLVPAAAHNGQHAAGWDSVFSAPKSVSIQALVGGDQPSDSGAHASRRANPREVEDFAIAHQRGNRERVVSANVVGAAFNHLAARPVGDSRSWP